ncbi:MAG: PDZ domain-containing protein [Gemmatimonadetes bacterium]|nr:PDZ domain-containing protein [Gemmatimonadota bacterium]
MHRHLLLAPFLLAPLTVPALTAPEPAVAQSSDCRCVDPTGKEVLNCLCQPTPAVPIRSWDLILAEVDRPRLGVTLADDPAGAMVTGVTEDSPAARAGLEEGDIITAIDGRSLLSALDEKPLFLEDPFNLNPVERLVALARDWEAGEPVVVTYLRDGEERRVTAEPEAVATEEQKERLERALARSGRELALRSLMLPSSEMDPLSDRVRDASSTPMRELTQLADGLSFRYMGGSDFGIELTEMHDGLASYFGTDEGMLVLEADNEELGLRDGDVILRIGDREATSSSRVRRILRSYGDDEEVRMTIMREGREIEVIGRIGDG